jgi:NNP family nitrate/nitrite transporter-like MFS transporter
VAAAVILRDAPGRVRPTQPLGQRIGAAARLSVTWQLAGLYAVAFGGYVAFSVYLPTYLKTAYGLGQQDAANRMAGFVLLAVLARPLGGWLSDRINPARVLAGAFAIVTVGALAQASTPQLAPAGTIAFLAMAAALGTASGAVFALVAQRVPHEMVGSVTGLVGAAGGLGGFVPPLLMGSVYSHWSSYAAGLIALAAVAATCLTFTAIQRSGPRVRVNH